MNANVLKAIAVAAELTNTEFSKPALVAMEIELGSYPEQVTLEALRRCQRELTGRLTLAAIIDRIETADGRATADEAWTTAMQADDESVTVIWTEETQQAFEIARPALEINDKVGARMAFKAAYERLVKEARKKQIAPKWNASLGWDVEQRRIALEAAVQLGRIPETQAIGLLPAPPIDRHTTNKVLMLACENGSIVSPDIDRREKAKHNIAKIRETLAKGKAA